MIVLDAVERTVSVSSFGKKRLEEAKSSLGMSERKQLFTHVEAEGKPATKRNAKSKEVAA